MANHNQLKRVGLVGAFLSLGGLAAAASLEQSTAHPDDSRFIQRLEALPLPWQPDPNSLRNRVEADVTLPSGEEVQISLYSKRAFSGRLPEPSNVLQADLAAFPAGTDTTNIDAQPIREYLLWSGTFGNGGSYGPAGVTTQAYHSSVTRPAYPAPKQMGGDVVMTSNYTAKSYTGVKAVEHVGSGPAEAGHTLEAFETQALALARAAAYGDAMPHLEEMVLRQTPQDS